MRKVGFIPHRCIGGCGHVCSAAAAALAVALHCGDRGVGRGRLVSVEVTLWDTGGLRHMAAGPVRCLTYEEKTLGKSQQTNVKLHRGLR